MAINITEDLMSFFGSTNFYTMEARQETAIAIGMTGNPQKAFRLQEKVFNHYKELLGDNHLKTIKASLILADLTLHAKKFNESLDRFKKARNKIDFNDIRSTYEQRYALMGIANSKFNLARPKEAIKALSEKIQIEKKALSPSHPAVADSYDALGRFQFEIHDYSAAAEAFIKAKMLRFKCEEDDNCSHLRAGIQSSYRLAKCFDRLKKFHSYRTEMTEALKLQWKLAQLENNSNKQLDARLLSDLIHRIAFYKVRNPTHFPNFDTDKQFAMLIKFTTKNFSKNHLATIGVLSRYVVHCRLLKEYDKAENWIQETLNRCKKLKENYPADVESYLIPSLLYQEQTEIHRKNGQTQSAKRTARLAVAKIETAVQIGDHSEKSIGMMMPFILGSLKNRTFWTDKQKEQLKDCLRRLQTPNGIRKRLY